jgi:transaldolase
MKLFIDSADIEEIKSVFEYGICDGVTTNPTLVAKTGQDFKTMLKQIVNIVPGPVSAEVIATEYREMLKEAEELIKVANNIVIKLPLTLDGLRACKILTGKGIKTNMTLCFTVSQALLAAHAGATYVSIFVGRLEDIGENGIKVISDVRTLFNANKIESKILAASIRNSGHVSDVALAGADVATVPFKVLDELHKHPLTDQGLAQFLEDWQKLELLTKLKSE